MSDPYPRRIRMVLEACRDDGMSFTEAWSRAVRVVGERGAWTPLLQFMEMHFRFAYERCGGNGSASVLVEHIPRERPLPLPRTSTPPTHCRSLLCESRVVKGKRFCPKHVAQLARVRLDYEREARRYIGTPEDIVAA